MTDAPTLLIAGAGGIGEAAAYMLLDWSDVPVGSVILADTDEAQLERARQFVGHEDRLRTVHAPVSADPVPALAEAFAEADVVLDCLPGGLAPTVARLALENGCHYANLTEYVAETNEIMELAEGAETGFVLQTGLAPGVINVLGHKLMRQFEADYGGRVDTVAMKVGALTRNASGPHHYGFTWSPIGVATEYVKDAIVVRDGEVRTVPALSERSTLVLGGVVYEDDLTSGGAADMPQHFAGTVQTLDYKTLRYPGHYAWVDSVLNETGHDPDALQARMEQEIPLVEDDIVVMYAAVEGIDANGSRRRLDRGYVIEPIETPNGPMRAIQATTAAGLVESAKVLLSGRHSGPVLQMDLDPDAFLNGVFVGRVYR
ncbi:MAG: saccharopine dehydrogenase NADP-binding domain-containing protein [Bacteroidota bacterium]